MTSIYYIINQIKNDSNNIDLICYSAELRTYYNAAVYYLRELTLVNFIYNNSNLIKYYEYPQYKGNRTNYIKSLRSKIRNIYIETHVLTESLTSVSFPLSDEASHFLEDYNLTLFVLTNNLTIYKIKTSFIISLVQLNSVLYNLAISDTYITQNSTDVYIFIYNFLNEVGEGIISQIDIYINELELRMKSKRKNLIIGMIVILVLLIIILVIFCISYKSIIKKKSSYIEVFYGIKISFIRQSIKNCEHFIYFLKKQKREDESGLKHDKNSTANSGEIEKEFEEEMKIYNNSGLNKNMNDEYFILNRRNTLNHNNNKDSSSITCFVIIILIYIIIIFIFFIFICLSYNKFMNSFYEKSQFIFHLQRIQNTPIDFFNGYREFIFDENSIIYGNKSDDYLEMKLEEIFATKGNDFYFANSTYSNIKNFKNTFLKFNSDSLCSRMEESFFNSEEECLNYLQGQIRYGYQISSFTFIDLIRIGITFIKYYFDKNMNIGGNLTEYGINDYEDIEKENKTFRLFLFNNDTTHSKINILFVHALLPYYINIVNISSNAIIEETNYLDSNFFIYMICYISINSVLFLFVWIPFIKNMNSVIYNAKKVLGIIPIHILSTLNNIKKILNLEKSKIN